MKKLLLLLLFSCLLSASNLIPKNSYEKVVNGITKAGKRKAKHYKELCIGGVLFEVRDYGTKKPTIVDYYKSSRCKKGR